LQSRARPNRANVSGVRVSGRPPRRFNKYQQQVYETTSPALVYAKSYSWYNVYSQPYSTPWLSYPYYSPYYQQQRQPNATRFRPNYYSQY